MSWEISDKATEKEKIFAEFNDSVDGLNCVGKIDYDAYSQIYDFGRTLADREYERGKTDGIQKFAGWCYVHGIQFDFMGHIDECGHLDVPKIIENIIEQYKKEQKGGEQDAENNP